MAEVLNHLWLGHLFKTKWLGLCGLHSTRSYVVLVPLLPVKEFWLAGLLKSFLQDNTQRVPWKTFARRSSSDGSDF